MNKTADFLNHFIKAAAYCAIALFAITAIADSQSPVGQWKTIDDKTGKEKSIIEIMSIDGILTGKIIKLLNPSKPNPVCEKCKGEKKDKPIEGMTILEGVSQKGKSWKGGTILDPKNGKTYKVTMKLVEEGAKLKVRGYIGIPTLGRTQTWIRVQ